MGVAPPCVQTRYCMQKKPDRRGHHTNIDMLSTDDDPPSHYCFVIWKYQLRSVIFKLNCIRIYPLRCIILFSKKSQKHLKFLMCGVTELCGFFLWMNNILCPWLQTRVFGPLKETQDKSDLIINWLICCSFFYSKFCLLSWHFSNIFHFIVKPWIL